MRVEETCDHECEEEAERDEEQKRGEMEPERVQSMAEIVIQCEQGGDERPVD